MAERSSGDSDEAILRALDAAPAAFAIFYRRHVAELLCDLADRTDDPRLAAELCAETFAAALACAHRFDAARGSAAAWLHEIAERELAHAERRGAARDRARRRLGLAPLEPSRHALARRAAAAAPVAGFGEGFVADLEDELVAAARFRAERRAHRVSLPRPSRAGLRYTIAGIAALALVAVIAALVLRGGDDDTAAGGRSAAALPPSVRFRLLPMQPLARCPEPARRPLGDVGGKHRIALLSRPQRRSGDALPLASRMLPIGTFDPRSTRRATHAQLWSTVYVVPSLDVAADGECGSHVGPGLCLVADEQEFRCFTAVDVEWGRAVARTTAATLVGIVPDGVERVTIRGFGPPVGADVADNVYEARMDVPAGHGVEVAFDPPRDDGCRRTVDPELLSEVALLRDEAQRGYELPQAAHDALVQWGLQLDAVVEEGARFWGGGAAIDFWAVPVVPRGRDGCAPASRVCVVAVSDRSGAAAQCVLGRSRRGQSWGLGQLFPERSVIFGTVPDGVTGVRVEHPGETVDVDAHDNVFGGVLPFPYRVRDVLRVKLLRGTSDTKPRVGIVGAGRSVRDLVGRLRALGYKTLDEITPGVAPQPRTSLYWWPGRGARREARELARAVAANEVVRIDDTDRIPPPVLDNGASVVVVVGERSF